MTTKQTEKKRESNAKTPTRRRSQKGTVNRRKPLETLVAISVNEDKASSKAARTTKSRGNGRRRSTQIFGQARQCGKPQLVDTDTHLLAQCKYKQVQLFAKNRKKIEERQERQARQEREEGSRRQTDADRDSRSVHTFSNNTVGVSEMA